MIAPIKKETNLFIKPVLSWKKSISMKRLGAKFLIFYKTTKAYTRVQKQAVKNLLKQFFGWQELALNGGNFPKDTANGIVCFVDLMLDATVVRALVCAAGYGNQSLEGLGRSTRGFSSKIHAKVDALVNPLQFIITLGQTNEGTQAKTLLDGVYNSQVIADKAYGSAEIRSQIRSQNCEDVIIPRSNSINPVK